MKTLQYGSPSETDVNLRMFARMSPSDAVRLALCENQHATDDATRMAQGKAAVRSPCKRLVRHTYRKEQARRLEEETMEEEKAAPVETVHETLAVDPPKWSDALRNRNYGPWVFGGIIGSLALYLIYLVFIKDRTAELNQIDTDLDDVTSKLQRLKEIRMEPDLSDTDIIRVRSFLLALIIKQKKKDPAKVINSALSLLGERHLNKKEKKLVLGFDERLRPQTPEAEEDVASFPNPLTTINVSAAQNKNLTSIAFDPDASVLWWRKLPYICVLQMKRSRAVFMATVTGRGDDSFALVGFEDPEEAFHAGKMPVHEQYWGLLSAFKNGTALPAHPLEDEKHFDLTWLHPNEFNALIESAKCYGLVIPAGTLRSTLTYRPIPPKEIKPAIDRICLDEKIGATEARPSQLDAVMDSSDNADGEDDSIVRSLEEDGVDLLQEREVTSEIVSGNGTMHQEEEAASEVVNGNGIMHQEEEAASEVVSGNGTMHQEEEAASEVVNGNGIMHQEEEAASEVVNGNGIMHQEEEAASEVVNGNGIMHQEELKDISATGRSSVTPQEQLLSKTTSESNGNLDNDTSRELLQNRPLSAENANGTMASSSATVSRNGADSPVDKTTTADSPAPWWMLLDSVIIPKIKPGGQQGGNVEINISIDPDVSDFRPILFEDEREAKEFLGILGTLHGPETLVATVAQSPSEFLAENSELKRDKIVVLCTGSLLLYRDADRNAIRNAVRMAHVATEIKKGVSSGVPGDGIETDLDKRVKEVAKDVVSNFKDRLDSNIHSESRRGDASYQDPVDGLIHDLEHGGLDVMLGMKGDDGISAKVGEDDERQPFSGFSDGRNEPDDLLYQQFAAQMTESIDKAQESLRNANAASSVPNFQSNHAQDQELNVSIDALIHEKEVEEEREFEKQGDGIEVLFPQSAENDKSPGRGSRWFRELDAIYVPTYLSVRGFKTYLVMSVADAKKSFVIAFQDRNDAMACKEMMKTWQDKHYIAAGIEMVPPYTLLDFCQEADVEPVVLRRSSVPLTVGMSQSDFLHRIAVIVNAQTTNYPLFNG